MTASIMLIAFICAILVLIVCSAAVSATETAITAVSEPAIALRAREGNPAALRLEQLLNQKESTIGALLLANNIFNILGAALATDLFLHLIGEAGVALATIVMTILVVIFAEVLPKTYAIRDPEGFALRMAVPAAMLVQTVRPVSFVLGRIVFAALKVLRADDDTIASISPAQQLRMTLAGFRGDRRLEPKRRQMLKGILELDRAKVEVALTHRAQMISLDANLTAGELASRIATIPFSRLPLWQGDKENIVGILHVRDLIGTKPSTRLRELMRAPWFIPVTTSLQTQLDAFIERRSHLALVVDEYGDLKGLVTLEDIVEEITGEIDDESDLTRSVANVDKNGCANVPAHMPVGEVNRLMDWDLPLEHAATIGGLVAEMGFRQPHQGQNIILLGHRIEVLAISDHQSVEFRLIPDC